MPTRTFIPGGPLAALAALADRYDVILSDVWGVLHNGIEAYPSAGAALTAFRAAGGSVALITNAPRPSDPIVGMLDRLGVPATAWDGIVSSGDCTRAMIAPYQGRLIHHVGPPTHDDRLYEGLGVVRGPAEKAEVVVVTDLDPTEPDPQRYAERLRFWLSRKLPMICANPDKVVEVGGALRYCAGALADLYAELGGEVLMAGKPYVPIYDEALGIAEKALGRSVPRQRVLAIGDSVRTDAAGAAAFGVDFLFITGSVHAEELDAFGTPDIEQVQSLVAPSGARMIGFMPILA